MVNLTAKPDRAKEELKWQTHLDVGMACTEFLGNGQRKILLAIN